MYISKWDFVLVVGIPQICVIFLNEDLTILKYYVDRERSDSRE